jgi:hypothetical protein
LLLIKGGEFKFNIFLFEKEKLVSTNENNRFLKIIFTTFSFVSNFAI